MTRTIARTGLLAATRTFDSKHLLVLLDEDGDENLHLYRVAVATADVVDPTPIEHVRAEQIWLLPRKPRLLAWAVDNDLKVRFAQSAKTSAMKAKGIPVGHVVFPDEAPSVRVVAAIPRQRSRPRS